jgi:hypothetical protein
MAFDDALAVRVRGCLARRKGVEERTLFGCACFLVGGHVAVGVWGTRSSPASARTGTRTRCSNPTSGSSTSPAGR